MLDHAGDILLLFVGFWRFLFSAPYRRTKLEEWKKARASGGGLELAALEIAAAIAFGVLLPAWAIALLVTR